MQNPPFFLYERNEISPEHRDFLVEASAVSGFPCEGVSGLWVAESGSNSFLFGDVDRDAFENERSETRNLF